MEPVFAWNVPLVSLIFLKRSLVFPIVMFSSISLHWSLKKAFLSLLANFWNSAFRCLYRSFSPLLFTSLFTAICKDKIFSLWRAVLRWQRNRTGSTLSPHKFIKKTFERWVNSTKQLLNAGRGHQAPRKAAHCLQKEVGKKYKRQKKKKRERERQKR